MTKVLGWGLTILAIVLLIWQLVISTPLLPNAASAILLAVISTLAGIRIGVSGTTAYIQDVQRLNKVLAEQHHELEELNANLLKEISAEAEARPAEQNLS